MDSILPPSFFLLVRCPMRFFTLLWWRLTAGAFHDLLACGLTAAGYRVTCAESLISDPAHRERDKLGIGHVAIPTENQYDPEFRIDLGRPSRGTGAAVVPCSTRM